MARLDKIVSDFLLLIRKDIIARANQKDQNVSKKIPKSLRVETQMDDDMFVATLVGFEWIVAAWETGRGPRKSKKKTDFEEKLARWIKRKGLDIKPASLRWLINNRGTLLHQGKDKRFSGKRSGTLSDFITEKRLKKLAKEISNEIVKTEITPLLKFTK